MEERSGIDADELFLPGSELSYEHFLLLDTSLTEIDRADISLEAVLGKDITLQTPIIAAPMDTVTNAQVCIELALEGGIGAIHYNYKKSNGDPDIEKQAAEITLVKRSQAGFVEHPVTVSPDMTIAEAIQRGERFRVGKQTIDTFPVTENGEENGKLVGLLRKADYSKISHTNLLVRERMIELDKLVYEQSSDVDPITLERANEILWREHVPVLPLVDNKGNLLKLVTRTDIDKNEQYPLATTDEKNRLRVLFAVETWEQPGYERLEACFAAGADGVIIDTSQGFTKYEKAMIAHIIYKFPKKLLIGGNVSTLEAAQWLAEMGVDAYRCGQASGSICTTAGAIGIGRANATGIYECARAIRRLEDHKPVTIADGGIKEVGDIVKALAIGAGAVMCGQLLAGTEEGPGEMIHHPRTNEPVKVYRGMGSKEANVGRTRAYGTLPQGISDFAPYRDSIHDWVPQIRDGLLAAFHAHNMRNIVAYHKKLESGDLRFGRLAGAVKGIGARR